MVKMTQADVLVISTIAGNASLCLLLLWRGWSGRLGWFTFMTGLAGVMDCLFHFIHDFSHYLYAPLRIFVVYWMFNVLTALVVYEAWRVRVRWLEWLFSVQLFVSLIALFAHQHGDKATVYWIEMFYVYLNLCGILWCIMKFKGEPRYEPPDARS